MEINRIILCCIKCHKSPSDFYIRWALLYSKLLNLQKIQDLYLDFSVNNIIQVKCMEKNIKTEHTILKILDAAMNELGKNGYSGGDVNNICNTGINKGLLYHNFKGKDDIYLNCLKRSCKKLLD